MPVIFLSYIIRVNTEYTVLILSPCSWKMATEMFRCKAVRWLSFWVNLLSDWSISRSWHPRISRSHVGWWHHWERNRCCPGREKKPFIIIQAGLILHGGIEEDCLHTPWSLHWCPWIAPLETYNLLTGCHFYGGMVHAFSRGKCLIGALALSKAKHTGLLKRIMFAKPVSQC